MATTAVILVLLSVLPATNAYTIRCEEAKWTYVASLGYSLRLIQTRFRCYGALRGCKVFNGVAMVIANAQTQQAVETYISGLQLPEQSQDIYIGLINRPGGGHQWADGTLLKGQYTNWAEPEDDADLGCNVISVNNGKWRKTSKDNYNWFLCQSYKPCKIVTTIVISGALRLGAMGLWISQPDDVSVYCYLRGYAQIVVKNIRLSCDGVETKQGKADHAVLRIMLPASTSVPIQKCNCVTTLTNGNEHKQFVRIYSSEIGLSILSSRLLNKITSLTQGKHIYNRSRLARIVHDLGNLVNYMNLTVTCRVGDNIMKAISMITECCFDSLETETRRDMIYFVEKVAAGIPLEDGQFFDFSSTNIDLSVYLVSAQRATNIRRAIICNHLPPNSNRLILLTLAWPATRCNENTTDVAVNIPIHSIMESLPGEGKSILGRISVRMFEKEIFPLSTLLHNMNGSNSNCSGEIISKVISIDLLGMPVVDLKENILLSFIPRREAAPPLMYKCVFWNEGSESKPSGWDGEGCSIAERDEKFVTCACNHMTNFALMLVVDERTLAKHNRSLDLLSVIGCIISAVALFLTLLIYAMLPTHGKDTQSKIMMNLSVSLLMANILYIVNTFAMYAADYVDMIIFCNVLAMGIHFYMLVSLMWVSCDGYYLAISIADDFDESEAHYIATFTLVSWSLPALVVIATGATPPLENYRSMNDGRCWIRTPTVFYVLVVPAGLFMVFNCAIFIFVLHSVRSSSGELDSYKKMMVMKQVKGSVSLFSLLFLTWIFGVVGIGSVQVVFSYLFVFFNGLQGYFLFLFFCFRHPEGINNILNWLSGGNVEEGVNTEDNDDESERGDEEQVVSTELSNSLDMFPPSSATGDARSAKSTFIY